MERTKDIPKYLQLYVLVLVLGCSSCQILEFPRCVANQTEHNQLQQKNEDVEVIIYIKNQGNYFEIQAVNITNSTSYLVTLIPKNPPANNYVAGIEIQAHAADDESTQPQGEWNTIDGGTVYNCAGTKDTIGEFSFPDEVIKEDYRYQWTPALELSASYVIFRAAVLYHEKVNEIVTQQEIYYDIHTNHSLCTNKELDTATPTSTVMEAISEAKADLVNTVMEAPTEENPDSANIAEPSLRFDIIIICSCVLLVVILIIALSLFCVYKKRKRNGQDRPALMNDSEAGNYQLGVVNNEGHEESIDDKLGELPKTPSGRKKSSLLSDAVKEEIESSGGTMGIRRETTEIARSHVIMQEQIGGGAFGDVFKAQAYGIAKAPITTVAVKVLKDPSMADIAFKKELKILMTFSPHPNIIQLMGTCTEKEPYFLVLEYAEFGDLRAYLHKKRKGSTQKTFDPNQLITFAVQIATGMEYIESQQCIHRDLATRNVLLGKDLRCKLSDFGLARNVDHKSQYKMQTDAAVPVRWMAPESIRDNIYSIKSDVWSFGVLCWELVTMGSHPYGGYKASQVIKMVTTGRRLEKPEHCSTEMYDVIMKSCWQDKPARRPGFTNLRVQLETILKNAEDNIVRKQFNVKSYVYLRPEHWQNSDGDEKPQKMKKDKKKRRPMPDKLEFDGKPDNK